jgi:phage replication-related protein YjqB (UPF0714/DUF867 family)
MADKYPNFEVLSRHETAGVDYRILARGARRAFAAVAPHGGGIEPGTSELADAIGGQDLSFYAFEGLKRSGNGGLHITSTRFDEPVCLGLVAQSAVVVTIHGEDSDAPGDGVFLGGLDDELGRCIGRALRAAGFAVRRHPDPELQGREPDNLCNRGTSERGVQLELSRTVRAEMFSSLSREGRRCKTARFYDFVEAVRGVLVIHLPVRAQRRKRAMAG